MKRDDLLDLNDVLQHPGRKLAVDISTELPEEEDLDLLKPVEGFLEAVSTGNLLLITGKFNARAVLECARCTGPVEADIEFEVDEQFPVEGVPSSLMQQDFAKVVPDEPFEMFEGNSLMVEALLRQAFHLSLPLQPLCPFGWEGACPQAEAIGIDNQPPLTDHPFESLSKLLHAEEDEA
jgi:uncharacterized metal-binding protein YceD (DUF177 family)